MEALPKISGDELPIWDSKRDVCGGFLLKKAGDASKFSKGKWQKRWFSITLKILSHENYALSYYYSAEDSKPSKTFQLDAARVEMSEPRSPTESSFDLISLDGSKVTLSAENEDTTQAWLLSLEELIRVATIRGGVQRQRRGNKPVEVPLASIPTSAPMKASQQHQAQYAYGAQQHLQYSTQSPGEGSYMQGMRPDMHDQGFESAFHYPKRKFPEIRLDIDINSMPPGSSERNQFEEELVNDITRILKIVDADVDIKHVRPSPGKSWLTTVEIDIIPRYDEDEDIDPNELEEKLQSRRRQLLGSLLSMLKDTFSPLYSGFVTSKLDPTYNKNFPGGLDSEAVPLFSSDEKILEIMNKYKDISLPDSFIDISHFQIYLSFEGRVRPLLVPNPLILRKRNCNIWPYEVKEALGITGTMQELWLEPVSLIPTGMPTELSLAIFFEPSARLNGAVAINASRLKADLTYEVTCEDFRGDIMKSLTEEEHLKIKETFDAYDNDGNGAVSTFEMEHMVKQRIADRKAAIEEKFQIYLEESTSEAERTRAEEQKRSYLQQLTESQNKLIKMFQMADLDGNGELSFTEFLLAEAWFMRCAINPDHAHLF